MSKIKGDIDSNHNRVKSIKKSNFKPRKCENLVIIYKIIDSIKKEKLRKETNKSINKFIEDHNDIYDYKIKFDSKIGNIFKCIVI